MSNLRTNKYKRPVTTTHLYKELQNIWKLYIHTGNNVFMHLNSYVEKTLCVWVGT